jgi:hypothetical protein
VAARWVREWCDEAQLPQCEAEEAAVGGLRRETRIQTRFDPAQDHPYRPHLAGCEACPWRCSPWGRMRRVRVRLLHRPCELTQPLQPRLHPLHTPPHQGRRACCEGFHNPQSSWLTADVPARCEPCSASASADACTQRRRTMIHTPIHHENQHYPPSCAAVCSPRYSAGYSQRPLLARAAQPTVGSACKVCICEGCKLNEQNGD